MVLIPPKSLSLSAWQAIAASAGTLRRISVPVEPQPKDTAEFFPHEDGITWLGLSADVWPRGVAVAPFAVGDRIALKERWADAWDDEHSPVIAYEAGGAYYAGTGRNGGEMLLTDIGLVEARVERAWQPADTMPLWAVRHFAVVRAVTPYRVRETTLEQAQAEGCESKGQFHRLWIQRHGGRFPFDTAWAWGVEVDVERVTRH